MMKCLIISTYTPHSRWQKGKTMKFILYIFIALFGFVMCGMSLYTAISADSNQIKMLFCTFVSAAIAITALLFAGGIIND